METNFNNSLIDFNMYINQIRGSWVQLAKKFNINYHEMLLMYHLYRHGSCTQKLICEYYLLPKQTVNNIVMDMKERAFIEMGFAENNRKEKVLVLTDAGKEYISSLVLSMNKVEENMAGKMGEENLSQLANLLIEYGNIIREEISAD